jgi:hypothetical protein
MGDLPKAEAERAGAGIDNDGLRLRKMVVPTWNQARTGRRRGRCFFHNAGWGSAMQRKPAFRGRKPGGNGIPGGGAHLELPG